MVCRMPHNVPDDRTICESSHSFKKSLTENVEILYFQYVKYKHNLQTFTCEKNHAFVKENVPLSVFASLQITEQTIKSRHLLYFCN